MASQQGPRQATRRTFGFPPRLLAWMSGAVVFPALLFGTQPTPQQIIKLSIASTQADWKATPQFSYVERDDDVKGGAKVSKTYQVSMIDGSPYSRLIAVNGEPLTPAPEAQERQKLQKEIARRASESPRARAARLAAYHKDRSRMFALVDEMGAAFDFKLLREQNLDGHAVYVFSASPRPGYQPRSWETRILKGMKGTLWVDRNSDQWVKVEAVAIKPVTLGWFIAKVLPGTRFLLEQTPVSPGLWQPEHFSLEAHARILLWQKNIVHSETYSDYQRVAGSPISGRSRRSSKAM